jgi:RHH-type proline utilization regulon transcriptional repressor/proline dehydrogenase/delta 1-pyrroline-5-carboxylate dehydrogenase
MGKSAFGPGIKVGGPNYLAQLMDFEECADPDLDQPVRNPQLADLGERLESLADLPDGVSRREVSRVVAAIGSYDRSVREEFGRTHDHFRLVGQDNLRRYRPVREMRIRLHPDDAFFDLYARVAAARAVGCRITVSTPPDCGIADLALLEDVTEPWAGAIEFVEETEARLAQVIRAGETDRVRYAAPDRVSPEIFAASAKSGLFVARAPVLAEGRIELLWYVREQSISCDYHRYGNLGERGEEQRAEVL